MKHFLAAAGTASFYVRDFPNYERQGQAEIYASALGYALELDQFLAGDPSGFSYEDLPSNAAGAKFGAYGYDPNSEVTLGEQIREWLNKEADPIDKPKEAPSYNQLPATYDPKNRPPKNFTPKPYKFPEANQEDGG